MVDINIYAGERSYMMITCPECGSYVTISAIPYREFAGEVGCVWCKAIIRLQLGEDTGHRIVAKQAEVTLPGERSRVRALRRQVDLPG